jgi:thiamine-monophosphate kinase
VPVTIGDDTAVVEVPEGHSLLLTTDSLVEGVHWHRDVAWRQIGRHVISVNVSDIAAMGGTPMYALSAPVLSPSLSEEDFLDLYEGINEACIVYGIAVVGGNLARTAGPTVLTVTLVGFARPDSIIRRSGARPGDALCVTGMLGATAVDRARSMAHGRTWGWNVEARVATARALSEVGIVHAMIDLSDGLSGDLRHLCTASGVGALIQEDQIPIHENARRWARETQTDPLSWALNGGEDYELLLALPPARVHEARGLTAPVPLTPIGKVLPGSEGILLACSNGERRPLEPRAWDHF